LFNIDQFKWVVLACYAPNSAFEASTALSPRTAARDANTLRPLSDELIIAHNDRSVSWFTVGACVRVARGNTEGYGIGAAAWTITRAEHLCSRLNHRRVRECCHRCRKRKCGEHHSYSTYFVRGTKADTPTRNARLFLNRNGLTAVSFPRED
jgi:hypothetical protein